MIFSFVILGLAGLAYQVARRTTRSTDQAMVMSMLNSRVDRASTAEYDSLATIANCDTTQVGAAMVIGCTTRVPISAVRTDMRIVVRTTVPGNHPDTILIQRARVRYPIPLK